MRARATYRFTIPGVWHRDRHVPVLRRHTQDYCQHRAARGHREDPLAPRAHGAAAASAGAAARCTGAAGAVPAAVNSKGEGDEAPATCRSDWQARYPHFPADGAGAESPTSGAMCGVRPCAPMPRTSLGLMACSATLLLTACFTFTTGVEEPDLASESARIASPIHVGQATRQEVRRLLGTPIFEDPSWGIELYRSKHTDMSTEWLAAPVPFPSWVKVIEYRLYPVIVYSSSVSVVTGTCRPQRPFSPGATRARPLRYQHPESRPGCQDCPG